MAPELTWILALSGPPRQGTPPTLLARADEVIE
jgi:hypothetical protein